MIYLTFKAVVVLKRKKNNCTFPMIHSFLGQLIGTDEELR